MGGAEHWKAELWTLLLWDFKARLGKAARGLSGSVLDQGTGGNKGSSLLLFSLLLLCPLGEPTQDSVRIPAVLHPCSPKLG